MCIRIDGFLCHCRASGGRLDKLWHSYRLHEKHVDCWCRVQLSHSSACRSDCHAILPDRTRFGHVDRTAYARSDRASVPIAVGKTGQPRRSRRIRATFVAGLVYGVTRSARLGPSATLRKAAGLRYRAFSHAKRTNSVGCPPLQGMHARFSGEVCCAGKKDLAGKA